MKRVCVLLGFCAALTVASPAQVLTTLYSFCPEQYCPDGANPYAGLVQATDGNFYGTATGGGAHAEGGTVFQITPGGTLTTLYSFCAEQGCVDGVGPYAGLVQATDGNFYGTTNGGGAKGGGTVFRISSGGTLTPLYSFCSESNCADGGQPNGLVLATDGNFYGTTGVGGANKYGTVFRITSSGALTTLYTFCSQQNCADGGAPQDALVTGYRRQPLWDDLLWRGQPVPVWCRRLRHGLQNHSRRFADHALQFLFSTELR